MIMNNRIDEFASTGPYAEPTHREQNFPADALRQYAATVKEWAVRNPIPCLAAAFVTGVAIAWIIKRK